MHHSRLSKLFSTLAFLLLTPVAAFAAAKHLQVTEAPGGSVTTTFGPGFSLNKGSSLERQWLTVKDTGSPVRLESAGIEVSHAEGGFYFSSTGEMQVTQPVAALEIRFTLFDAWNRPLRTLSTTTLRDLAAGETVALRDKWKASNDEASQYLTLVAYVAHVRLADGTVWSTRLEPLHETLQDMRFELHEDALLPSGDDR